MVMDVTPSPQCVGREFVRQYYTLLNKAPTHVHRFYNNNSSFVHGGLEAFNREGKPAVGQKQIHQCIQQLNFRDCHAKITQVDSQATLGNGVVVQVTGELSNGGQPMRRFTQTFVLGAQSPKQYYVHNDIFRYQDLVFSDDDTEPEPHHYEPEEDEPEHTQPPEIPQVDVFVQQPSQLEQAQYYTSAPLTAVNGSSHTEEPPAQPLPQAPPPPATPNYNEIISQQHVQAGGQSGYQSEECEPDLEEAEEVVEEKPADEYSPSLEQEQPSTDNISSNEPKTYASTLVKSGGGVANFNTSPTAPSKSPPSPPPSMARLESRNNEMNASGGRGGLRPPRGAPGANMRGMGRGLDSRPPMTRPTTVDDNRDYGREELGVDEERRRPLNTQIRYPDDHQLFLGNLPLSASENDLKDLFRTFGNIVDLRIMSKSNMKGQNGNKVPNYGFIIFESTQTVQAVLNARPIYYPSENGVKLNVEEKKTKPRTDGGGRGGVRPTPMGMRGSLSRGGQRGGFTRGGGGMRPGPGFSQRGAPR